jgi:hypothetical protein
MRFNRQTALRQYGQAKAAAANPALPQSIRDLYQQSADHGQVALGLSNALEKKQQEDLNLRLPQEAEEEPVGAQQRMGQPGLLENASGTATAI